ncbi:MAG TPA: helix-hairpin-helix domain-containing protein [Elusimicrobiota bacterium]|nr:helix-hairpin-helix domain-containing protein [Elusimicrobiota bacterium]
MPPPRRFHSSGFACLWAAGLLAGFSVFSAAEEMESAGEVTDPPALSEPVRASSAPPVDLPPSLDEDQDSEEGASVDTGQKGDEDPLTELSEHPLDLNKAKIDDLIVLPGVDRPMAQNIVRERRRRKRFNAVDELTDVSGIDVAFLERIREYIVVEPLIEKGKRAFFSGDTRARMRNVNPRGSSFFNTPSQFQNNTYVYNRTRMRFGEQSQAGWLAKRPSVGMPLTPENNQRLSLFKFSVQESDAGWFDKVVIGNYTLCHGQGLIFYDGLGEYVRPAKVKARGAKQDFTSGANEYHKGVVVDGRVGFFDLEAFVSQKDLDFEVDSASGVVKADINSLRQGLGDLQDEEAVVNNDTVTERLYGGRVACALPGNTKVGATAYESHYSKVFRSDRTTYSDAHIFQGNKNVMAGVDFDSFYKSLNLYGEAARSRSSGPGMPHKTGTAWTVTPMLRLTPFVLWSSFFDYDADFFTRHGKGVSFAIVGAPEELTTNQRGVQMGLEYRGKKYTNRTNYYIATFPDAMGNGDNSDPVQASQGRQIYFENLYKVTRPVELYFRWQRTEQDFFPTLELNGASTGRRRQLLKDVQKFRYQVTWTASSQVRYRVRYETRYEDVPEYPTRAFGHLVMGDVKYKPTRDLTLNARVYFFDSPTASLTTGVEEIWDKTVYYRLAGAMNSLKGDPGTRFYLIAKQRLGRDLSVWMKYDVNYRPGKTRSIERTVSDQESAAFGSTRQGFHMQVDYKWGNSGRLKEDTEYRTLSDEFTSQE